MKNDDDNTHDAWARLRFAIVGPLLAAPPGKGKLGSELKRLAAQSWRHPITGERTKFGFSTVERWYYTVKNEQRDPVGALRRQVRSDAGTQPSLSAKLREVLRAQYREHSGWSYKLHADNVLVVAEQDVRVGKVPSYPTVRRYMRATGMTKVRPQSRRQTEGTERAARRLETREVRSYEVEHVHGLWHTDFHAGSRKVMTRTGFVTPHLFGVLDDHSRVGCHLQWYLNETAESFAHGLSQAFQKRGLPRALLSDNGSAMVAGEIENGFCDLSVLHETTLADSPYQNGKQESFWNQVETRLMAMLEGVPELSLELLNEATQAWLELEYHRSVHSEIGMTPLARYLDGPDVGRDSPSSEQIRRAFRLKQWRTQRRSDGTVSICGRRLEVPSRYRHKTRLLVRYARWDLSNVDLVDPRTKAIVSPLYPQDKAKNADGRRRRLAPVATPDVSGNQPRSGKVAPLLSKLMHEYAQTGLPPAYVPKPEPKPKPDDPEEK